MKVRNVEKQYYLLVNQLPAAAGLYFRVVAAAAGYVDAISRPRGSYTIVPVTPPTMKVSTTVQLSGSGDGKTLDTPILVPGSFTIHVTAQTLGGFLSRESNFRLMAGLDSPLLMAARLSNTR